MRLHEMRWICAAATCLCAPSSLHAREAEPRIDAVLLHTVSPEPALRRHVLRDRTLSLLGAADRNGLKSTRAHGVERALGAFDLTIEGSRLHGGGDSPNEPSAAGDRYNASVLALTGGFDLGGGLHAGPTASLMHMRRRFSVVPAGLRPRTAAIASAGLGFWRDDGLMLSVDYVSARMRGIRPLDRMAEILGGAPLAGHGLRLGLSGGDRDGQTGGLTWGLDLSAMARPRQEYSIAPIGGSLTDKRVAVTIGLTF